MIYYVISIMDVKKLHMCLRWYVSFLQIVYDVVINFGAICEVNNDGGKIERNTIW
jgi:hypothetical protein